MSAPVIHKKLIEVSLPLDAINRASAREKSIRHGHPSTLHLWWARRPLAACRAVLFAQLVDDPSAWPDRFPTEDAQRQERDRLHELIKEMVPWEASTDETILGRARWYIARSFAWARGEEPPPVENGRAVLAYLAAHAPPVCDPFCGGGSIPLEAQRLGLRAIASDLNPVAVLITKALVEIPPKFAGLPPVNPQSRTEAARGGVWRSRGAQGLAEDVRYYGAWMREEAFKRIGRLYPQAELSNGSKATVIAWIWARTVRSPNPAAKGAMVPLVSSFLLSAKPGKEVWLEPKVETAAGTYRFCVHAGGTKAEIEAAKIGTKSGRGGFTCLLTGVALDLKYIRAEAQARRMSACLIAVVADGARGRTYLASTEQHERIAASAAPAWGPEELVTNPCHDVDRLPMYGMPRWRDAFTPRQLVALTTFADLVEEARTRIATDAATTSLPNDPRPLAEGGTGQQSYADAVATYLALALGKTADRNTSLCVWEQAMDRMRGTFGRQAIPMVWDYVETNPFAGSGGDFVGCCESLAKALANVGIGIGAIVHQRAAALPMDIRAIFSSDPPYYDNIGYADLSDFFYVWLRRAARNFHPALFGTLLTPKNEELIASPYRHGSKDKAEKFFVAGMQAAITRMATHTVADTPLTLYYAFKQSEQKAEGVASTGWATFLQAVYDAGLIVDGTWPMRTELASRAIGMGTNALASSIILACRRRPGDAPTATRNQFLAALRAELPAAIRVMQQEALAPVDLQQAAIGPGIGVFTRYAAVLESDDSPMQVRTALALINAELDAVLEEQEGEFDPATRFAITWFGSYGFEERPFGDAQNLARARAVGTDTLTHQHVLLARGGRARLLPRADLPEALPSDAPHWVQSHMLIHALLDHGETAAAAMLASLGPAAETCRDLAYRLFQVAERRKLIAEATDYNALVVAWSDLQRLAGEIPTAPAQGDFLAAV